MSYLDDTVTVPAVRLREGDVIVSAPGESWKVRAVFEHGDGRVHLILGSFTTDELRESKVPLDQPYPVRIPRPDAEPVCGSCRVPLIDGRCGCDLMSPLADADRRVFEREMWGAS